MAAIFVGDPAALSYNGELSVFAINYTGSGIFYLRDAQIGPLSPYDTMLPSFWTYVLTLVPDLLDAHTGDPLLS
jgi:hypothetical protein